MSHVHIKRSVTRTLTAFALSAVTTMIVSAPAQALPPAYPTPIGPFEYEHECLAAGNGGMENGQWPDYECNGSYGAWFVYPAEGNG